MTTNTTSFARHYLLAAEMLMDAIGTPSAEAFDLAHRSAIHAIDAAYVPGASWGAAAPGGSLEQNLGQELARSIENAARADGYVGLPAVRIRKEVRS
jgi:hypothetical protein